MNTEDECSKKPQWELETVNKGLHMHFMPNSGDHEAKTYTRCSMVRTFENKERKNVKYDSVWIDNDKEKKTKKQTQLYDDRAIKLEGNNKLYVRSGMNVYNSKKELVDQRSNDW